LAKILNQLKNIMFGSHLGWSLPSAIRISCWYGIRFAGIPSGYEFNSLVRAMIQVYERASGLKPAIRGQLEELKIPVQLHVIVTPN
jgi:alkyl hydroperoxide reductase subunit AhpF